LDLFRLAGALVERPAFGLVDVLLPEVLARQLGTDGLLRLAFHPDVAAANPEARLVAFGQPIFDAVIEKARGLGQVARWYLNDVRLEKANLFDVIKKETTFPNGWLQPVPGAMPRRQLHYYLRFNFKVAFVSDEKDETLASVIMDVSRGVRAAALEDAWEQLFLEREPRLGDLPEAPLTWAQGKSPLGEEILGQLQERAARVVADELGPTLETLQARTARRLELDLARLAAFYDQNEADLRRRLERTEDPARRHTLEEKLIAMQKDREAKKADVEAKYRLRVVLDLVNVAVIAQPKLAMPVQVGNRYATVQPDFVWDPLLHRLEPGVCHVCGRGDHRLHLCANGHLACDACILPCSVCKREYCRACEAEMGTCAVCGRGVCAKSQVRCETCGKIVCPDDQGRCHAAPAIKPAPAQIAEQPRPTTPQVKAPAPEAVAAAKRPPPVPEFDEQRFVQLAYGLLTYEGVLPLPELMARVTALGGWRVAETRTRGLALLHSDRRFRFLGRDTLTIAAVEDPRWVLEEKRARWLPPRDYHPEDLLAAADGRVSLGRVEQKVETWLRRNFPRRWSVRELQQRMKNVFDPDEFLGEILDQVRGISPEQTDQLVKLLGDLWNVTPRYELGGRSPNEMRRGRR